MRSAGDASEASAGLACIVVPDPALQPTGNVSLRRRFLSPQTVVSLAVLPVAVVLVVWRFDIAWSDTWEIIRALDLRWYAAGFAAHYTTFIFRGARWRLLLQNASRKDGGPVPGTLYAARVILLSWFANSVTWFRMGDAYRAYVYAEDSKSSFPRSMGSVLTDRLVDLAVVAFLMTLGVGVLLVGGQVRPPLFLVVIAAGLLAAIGAGLAGMVVARRWATPRLPRRVRDVYLRFHDGALSSFGRMHIVFALGVAGWLCEAGRLLCVVMAVGTPIALGLVLFVPMANGLLSALPLTPGGLGVVETGITGLLRLELAVEAAIAVALVDRTISYISIVFVGGIVFVARQVGTARRADAPPIGGNA